jgi:hypothetical protein
VNNVGELLNLDGSVKSQPGVGNSVDYANDDQISATVAANPVGETGGTEYLVVYAKHAPHQPAQDFDIWGARVQTVPPYQIFLPITTKS